MTLDSACVSCGHPSLSHESTPVSHLACPECEGRGLLAAAAKMLLLDVGEIPATEVGAAEGQSTPNANACFSCGNPSINVVIRHQNCVLCKSCGAMWLPKGAMKSLSGARWDESKTAAPMDIGFSSPDLDLAFTSPSDRNSVNIEPVASEQFAPPKEPELELKVASKQMNDDRLAGMKPLPPLDAKIDRKQRKAKKLVVKGTGGRARAGLSPVAKAGILAGIAITIVVGVLVVVLVVSAPKKMPERVTLSQEMLLKKYEVYFLNYPFGGRKLNWWQEALAESSPSGVFPDAKRHQVLRERIALLDLVIDEASGTQKVRASNKITQEIIKYLEMQ
ncbi:MAG: hypothetical protein GY822_24100 [Deltaproteobacteria bacterium]|nr:hypothetical protein [Deltaproteobacteria bacterium]